MRPYKSNSPQYLDYIAANLTRQQIMADPKLCVLLENEYIKDNTELAIRWFQAKYGDYQAKYDFAEYMMCNGPQIDADTLLHYREMALADPVITEIAYTYLSNTEVLVKLRKEKYGKDTDECFTKPCFYMGRFSAALGETGDIDAATSIFSFLGSLFKKTKDRAKPTVTANENAKNKVSLNNTALPGGAVGAVASAGTAAKNVANTAAEATAAATGKKNVNGASDKPQPADVTQPDGSPKKDIPRVGAMGPTSAQGVVPKPQLNGWSMIWNAIWNNDQMIYRTFTTQNCQKALYEGAFGDWEGCALQKFLQLNSAANIKRRMGDCSRLWRHVRQLRLFDTDNSFNQMTPDMKINGVNANGMYTQLYGKANPSAADVWSRLTDFNDTANSIRTASSANTTTNNSSTFSSQNGFSDTRGRGRDTNANATTDGSSSSTLSGFSDTRGRR